MEEDDRDELLQCTDDESLSDNEDHCLPLDKPEENYRHTLTYFNHTGAEFFATKILLVVSTTMLLVLLPLYLETINVKGNAYSMILMNTSLSSCIFVLTMVVAKVFSKEYKNINLLSFPLQFRKVIFLTVVYFTCLFMVVYSLDRKRVLCHLQDPIKGIVLVFSLLFYFFFCKKLMGLQRIFSATTIIVGLFIAVDYGLCDEFRCRGQERERLVDDSGSWSWQIHALWTTIYIVGLALFAAYFTILERYVLASHEVEFQAVSVPSSFLSTVSRAVSHPNSSEVPNQVLRNEQEHSPLNKKHCVVHLAMWIHVLGMFIVVGLFWMDFIPALGKGSNGAEFLNYTSNGIICHFQIPNLHKFNSSPCGNVWVVSWIFLCAYVNFVVVSIKFLLLSQSAVYTISTMSISLPLVGIWWSLFHVAAPNKGLMVWDPSVTGELICSLLGLPIILVGLILLCKSHFKDYQWCRLTTHLMPSNNLA